MWIIKLPHESQENINSLSQKSFQTLLLVYKPMWPNYVTTFNILNDLIILLWHETLVDHTLKTQMFNNAIQ